MGPVLVRPMKPPGQPGESTPLVWTLKQAVRVDATAVHGSDIKPSAVLSTLQLKTIKSL